MRLNQALGWSFWIFLVLTLGFGCAPPQKAAAPETAAVAQTQEKDWRFHAIVDVKFVEPYTRIPKPENAWIIDSRPTRTKYDHGYITHAISLPDSKFAQLAHLLPPNKDDLLIFYCEGAT